MTTITRTRKTARRLPMAPREYLITQRRLCADRKFHQFTLWFNGKITREDAEKFLSQCDELTFNIVPNPARGVYVVYLNTKR